MRTYLINQYDSKSFGNKAMIEETETGYNLWSYETLVVEIKNNKLTINSVYSQTTLRHIKEFALQNGFKADKKKQIEENYLAKG